MEACFDARKQSTANKLSMAEQVISQMKVLKAGQNIERRFQIVPVDFERRKAHG